MRRLMQPTEVHAVAGVPKYVRMGPGGGLGVYLHVQHIIDRWRFGGRWWRGEAARAYWLVELQGQQTIELYAEEQPEGLRWTISRLVD